MQTFSTNRQNVFSIIILIFLVFVTQISIAQPPDGFEDIDPITAIQGDTDVLVTITLLEQGAPPDDVPVESVTIGSLEGSNINRNGLIITAIFDFPMDASAGLQDVSVSFPSPEGTLTITQTDGFEVFPGASSGIAEISPASATQGDMGLLLTVTLVDSTAPPPEVDPTCIKIGDMEGTDINRDELTVTAIFDIPPEESTGFKEVSLTFLTEEDTIIFTESNAFEVLIDPASISFNLVDTNQQIFYDEQVEIPAPEEGEPFYGQDATYQSEYQPQYMDNGDGTVTDLSTGLMWQQDPGEKMTYEEALAGASTFDLAGYTDWRLPTIKELYSLILFNGTDPSGMEGDDTSDLIPFIDDDYFVFNYGNPDIGERIIDSQYASSTEYVGTTMNGDETLFGVNFADGRIKGYGLTINGQDKTFFVQYVREGSGYGINNFVDNGDGTITDLSTGLMWQQDDSQTGMNWEDALDYAEDLEFAGHSDWRLPDAKELQSIVDYTRSPSTSDSPAIDSIFNCTEITNEAGEPDYPYYWTSTTHANWTDIPGGNAAYITFGLAMGYMNGQWLDVHGAGAQRSDPKTGDPDDYPYGHGPQGDAIRIFNYVRCVRNAEDTGVGDAFDAWETQNLAYDANNDGMVDITDIQQLIAAGQFSLRSSNYPNPFNPDTAIQFYLPIEMPVEIKIYDMTGKLVKTLINDEREAGYHTVKWNGKNNDGSSLGSGIYIYAVKIDGYKEVKRMLLLK